MIDIRKLRMELDLRKVAVFQASDQSWSPIPVALSPTTIEAKQWRELERDAHHVMTAFLKLMTWLQLPNQRVLANKLCTGLSKFEAEFVTKSAIENWGHVTIRMDLFWHQNMIKIIEVNCTIPAMQAYADNVFYAWKNAGGAVQGDSNNSNELLDSLLAMYRLDGGRLARPRIVILHRDGDSQMGELLWLQQEWGGRGFETILADPTMLSRVGDVWVVNETPCDLVYRHIFAFRLRDHVAGEEMERNRSCHIYNPVSAHFEAKAFLALISQVSGDHELAKAVELTDEEIAAIVKRVPESRILGPGLSSEPKSIDGETGQESVHKKLDSLVIKRSVGYGGHQVIIGESWSMEETQKRLQYLTKMRGVISFEKFYNWVSTVDDSLWITQERMSGARRKTRVLTSQGIENWDAWFDASIFINTRTNSICRGGVSRISKFPVVNIGNGGGLAPFMIVPDAI